MAKWCNSQSPPQTAKPPVTQQAVREVSPHLVTRLTEHKTLDNLAWGNLVHNRFKKLRATVKLSQVCEDAGFTVTVVQGQFCVTRSAMELKGHGAISPCREFTHSRDDDKSYPKGMYGNSTRIGPAQCNRTELRWELIHWCKMDHSLGSSSAGLCKGK